MKKQIFLMGLFLLVISIVFTVLLTKVDTKPIGPNNSMVGFSTVNTKMTFDYNEKTYKISKYVGYVALLIPVVYAGIGILQLVKGKSLSKVDKKLYILAIFYVVVGLTYVIFEKIIINYRPVMMDNALEASFPSSHTLMALCFTLSAIIINKQLFKDKTKLINCCLFCLGIAVVVTRLVSGVHWFTDIIGAVFYSSALVMMFKSFVKE